MKTNYQHVALPYMSFGSLPEDTLWFIVEPDFTVYRVDAKTRVELVMKELVQRKIDFDDFVNHIEDPDMKETFRAQLSIWKRTKERTGSSFAPWPCSTTRPNKKSTRVVEEVTSRPGTNRAGETPEEGR